MTSRKLLICISWVISLFPQKRQEDKKLLQYLINNGTWNLQAAETLLPVDLPQKKKTCKQQCQAGDESFNFIDRWHQWFSCETSKSTIFASLDHETMVKTTLNSLIYILWKNLSEKTPPRAPFSTKQTTSQEFSQVYVTTGFPLESIRTYIAITSLEKLILGCSLHMPGWIAESTFFRAEWIILNLDIFTTHFLTLIILDQTSIRVLWISD